MIRAVLWWTLGALAWGLWMLHYALGTRGQLPW